MYFFNRSPLGVAFQVALVGLLMRPTFQMECPAGPSTPPQTPPQTPSPPQTPPSGSPPCPSAVKCPRVTPISCSFVKFSTRVTREGSFTGIGRRGRVLQFVRRMRIESVQRDQIVLSEHVLHRQRKCEFEIHA